jgi:hypothetical protein
VLGAPSGERNGQYRHGERTKAAIAERQKFSALLQAGGAIRWRAYDGGGTWGGSRMLDLRRREFITLLALADEVIE